MLLTDEAIWGVINGLWQETGSITYPQDPNLVQAKAIAKAQLKAVVEDIKKNTKGYEDRTIDTFLHSTYWQSILKEVE